MLSMSQNLSPALPYTSTRTIPILTVIVPNLFKWNFDDGYQ